MGKYKIKHIGWFFGFIWNCIRDLVSEPIGFFRYGIAKENWQDLGTRIYFDTDPKSIELTKRLGEYLNSVETIDPSLYMNITISNLNSNDMDTLEPTLTEEDFRAGKQGYVWLDDKTGKLVFKTKEK